MKGHIIRAILNQDMTVKWKDVEEGIPARLNVHQKARQFVEVELGDFLLAEDEAILAAFEKVKDGDTNHINPTVMEQVVGDKKVYRLQIPPEVHNEAGEWEIQFSVASNYSCDDSGKMSYDFVTDSDKLTFVEFSSLSNDGLTVPSGEDLKALLVKKIVEYNDAHYIRITGMSGTFTEEEAELIKTDFKNVRLILKESENDIFDFVFSPSLRLKHNDEKGWNFYSGISGEKWFNGKRDIRDKARLVSVTQTANGLEWVFKTFYESFDDLEDGRLKVYGAPKEDNDVVRWQEYNGLSETVEDLKDGTSPVEKAKLATTAGYATRAENDVNGESIAGQFKTLKSSIQKLANDLNTFFADADVSQNAIDTLLELQTYIEEDADFASRILLNIQALESEIEDSIQELTAVKVENDWLKSFVANGTVGLAYESNGTAWTCTGVGTATDTDIVISSHICGLPVKIAMSAFEKNKSLTRVIISNGAISIGDRAFLQCSNLAEILIPDSIVEAGVSCFNSCNSLTNVVVGSGLTTIPDTFFSSCRVLASVQIKGDVSKMDWGAFYGCKELKRVDLSNCTSVPRLQTSAFENTHSTLQIKVPASLYEQWKVATNWSEYADKIVTEFTNEV